MRMLRVLIWILSNNTIKRINEMCIAPIVAKKVFIISFLKRLSQNNTKNNKN